MTRLHRPSRRTIVATALAVALLATAALWTNVFGVGDRASDLAHRAVHKVELFLNPPPDRPIAADVRVTPRPTVAADPHAGADAGRVVRSFRSGATPRRVRSGPRSTSTSCSIRRTRSSARSTTSGARRPERRWSSRCTERPISRRRSSASCNRGSVNGRAAATASTGDWGPSAMAAALAAYGVDGYQVRTYDTRAEALLDAATAISDDARPGAAARLERRPHVGDDRLSRDRGPDGVRRREGHRRLHPRPVVSADLVHLGPVGSAGHVPGCREHGLQLPARGSDRRATTRVATASSSRWCRRCLGRPDRRR